MGSDPRPSMRIQERLISSLLRSLTGRSPCARGNRVRVLSIALLAVAPLLAQNAEISGLITDPSGRAVPGARISVENSNTAATRAVSSNVQGEYSVPALLPGPYNITVEANGFQTLHQNGIVVEVDQRARLDFALTIGSNTETHHGPGERAAAQRFRRIREYCDRQ